ncbi:penicillin-binding protein activator [Eionea flava]
MLLKHINRILMNIQAKFILTLCATVLLSLTACTTPTKDNSSTITTNSTTSRSELLAQAQQAEQLAPLEKSQTLLTVSERLLSMQAEIEARQTLQKIDTSLLNNSERARYLISISEAYLSATPSTISSLAIPKLTDEQLVNAINNASIEQQQAFYRNSASLYEITGNAASSIQQRITLDTLLADDVSLQRNSNQLWAYLSSLDINTLEQINTTTSNTGNVMKGWIELATTQRDASQNLNTQHQSLKAWQDRYAQHPANIYLPDSLRSLDALIAEQPQHIALLLPLEGKLAKAGESIRDGFFAAYYNHQNTQSNTPKVTLYDTGNNNIDNIYEQAIGNGADLVIGPLSKKNVDILSQKNNTQAPILALNYIDEKPFADPVNDPTSINPKNTSASTNTEQEKPEETQALAQQASSAFYQFGLSLEDEATQVADKAWQDGHRRALIIASPADWSHRATQAFINQWQALGGTIAENTTLDQTDSYSDSIQQALHIDQSKARASALKRLFGRSFDFEPRRRHDIDMIFLVTRAREGTQIKPTLNFYYASDLPVYATSQLYASTNSKSQNTDLNKIQLTVMPWITQENNPEKITLETHSNMTPGYEKLYALGVDSFLISSRLSQLSQPNSPQLYGATGQLTMDNHGRISRQQDWAIISNGKLELLPRDNSY